MKRKSGLVSCGSDLTTVLRRERCEISGKTELTLVHICLSLLTLVAPETRFSDAGISDVYIGSQRRNFFIPIYASCSGRLDVGQGRLNILQHLQPDRQYGAST